MSSLIQSLMICSTCQSAVGQTGVCQDAEQSFSYCFFLTLENWQALVGSSQLLPVLCLLLVLEFWPLLLRH